jgi:hypothetical protein
MSAGMAATATAPGVAPTTEMTATGEVSAASTTKVAGLRSFVASATAKPSEAL